MLPQSGNFSAEFSGDTYWYYTLTGIIVTFRVLDKSMYFVTSVSSDISYLVNCKCQICLWNIHILQYLKI